MLEKLKQKADFAPSSCGIYLFLKDGKPIYIGKSKNIKERLKAYFNFLDSRETVPKILQEADDLRWFVTSTEEDALFFEQKLIRENLPKYNIKLKDQRGLKYIRVDLSYEFPSLSLRRYPQKKDGAVYFGPFSSYDAREIFNVLKMFGIRTCTERKFSEFKKRNRPCLDGQIGVCSAPCVGMIKRSSYMKEIHKAMDFLKGKFSYVLRQLEERMWEESERENFEIAARIRDRISVIRNFFETKRLIFSDMRGGDYLSYDVVGGKLGIFVLKVREGRFFGGYGGAFEYGGQDILDMALGLFYDNSGSEGELITDLAERDFKLGGILVRPPREDENEVMLIAKKNAVEQILQTSNILLEKFRILEELRDFLLLRDTPRRIEVFDFSNFGGKNLVGVKVHFEDGEFVPSRIRLYNVSDEGYDDILALKNVLSRRVRDYFEGKDLPFPDLIFIDGGKGHWSVAREVFSSFGLRANFACIKKEERNTRDITLIFEREELKPKGKLLSFILSLRDSAHFRAKRFAVSKATKIK
ncbi:UvrABC system protein C [bacterium HR19]|nr:UvrABC system protein C [bacterium HR19]